MFLFYLFFISLISSTLAEDQKSDVFELTPSNQEKFLQDNNNIALLEFYAPWCGHCKSFAPVLETIATKLKTEHKIATAKCNGDEHKALAQKFGVQGYPTILVWKKGGSYMYKGERTEDGVIREVLKVNHKKWTPPKSHVQEMDSGNFTDIINGPLVIVMFYAPWCGHCKELKPHYEGAAELLISRDWDGNPMPVLARIDATKEKDIAKEYGITGYPTLKVFRNGKVSEYKGGMDQDKIVQAAEGLAYPPSRDISTVQHFLRAFIDSRTQTLFGCFKDATSELYKKHMEISAELIPGEESWIQIGHTFNEQQMKKLNCKPGEIWFYHPHYAQSKYEPKRFAIEKIEDIHRNSLPLVGDYNGGKEKLYKKIDKPWVQIFGHFDFNPEFRSASQYQRNKVLPVANEYKDKFVFAVLHDAHNKELMKSCNLQDSSEDINMCIAYKGKHFPWSPEDSFTGDMIREFLEQYSKGKVPRYLKSAKNPKKNDGPVKIIVGNSFTKEVMKKNKEVMIEFYAPWCGHCKKLEPIYKKLGKAYKDNKNVLIAKMDATTNDVPNDKFDVSGYPSLYWVDKNNKISKYDGGRDLKSMKKFIDERLADKKDEL